MVIEITTVEIFSRLEKIAARTRKKLVRTEGVEGLYESGRLYFNRDPAFEQLCPGYSLDKGLLLVGNVGVGKSAFFEVFEFVSYYDEGRQQNTTYRIKIEDASSISLSYRPSKNEENDIISKYANCGHLCLDDLGRDIPISSYGNQVDVIGEILMRRANTHYRTHATSNLSAEMLGKRYGNRLASRFYEMFNVVAVEGDDLRVPKA